MIFQQYSPAELAAFRLHIVKNFGPIAYELSLSFLVDNMPLALWLVPNFPLDESQNSYLAYTIKTLQSEQIKLYSHDYKNQAEKLRLKSSIVSLIKKLPNVYVDGFYMCITVGLGPLIKSIARPDNRIKMAVLAHNENMFADGSLDSQSDKNDAIAYDFLEDAASSEASASEQLLALTATSADKSSAASVKDLTIATNSATLLASNTPAAQAAQIETETEHSLSVDVKTAKSIAKSNFKPKAEADTKAKAASKLDLTATATSNLRDASVIVDLIKSTFTNSRSKTIESVLAKINQLKKEYDNQITPEEISKIIERYKDGPIDSDTLQILKAISLILFTADSSQEISTSGDFIKLLAQQLANCQPNVPTTAVIDLTDAADGNGANAESKKASAEIDSAANINTLVTAAQAETQTAQVEEQAALADDEVKVVLDDVHKPKVLALPTLSGITEIDLTQASRAECLDYLEQLYENSKLKFTQDTQNEDQDETQTNTELSEVNPLVQNIQRLLKEVNKHKNHLNELKNLARAHYANMQSTGQSETTEQNAAALEPAITSDHNAKAAFVQASANPNAALSSAQAASGSTSVSATALGPATSNTSTPAGADQSYSFSAEYSVGQSSFAPMNNASQGTAYLQGNSAYAIPQAQSPQRDLALEIRLQDLENSLKQVARFDFLIQEFKQKYPTFDQLPQDGFPTHPDPECLSDKDPKKAVFGFFFILDMDNPKPKSQCITDQMLYYYLQMLIYIHADMRVQIFKQLLEDFEKTQQRTKPKSIFEPTSLQDILLFPHITVDEKIDLNLCMEILSYISFVRDILHTRNPQEYPDKTLPPQFDLNKLNEFKRRYEQNRAEVGEEKVDEFALAVALDLAKSGELLAIKRKRAAAAEAKSKQIPPHHLALMSMRRSDKSDPRRLSHLEIARFIANNQSLQAQDNYATRLPSSENFREEETSYWQKVEQLQALNKYDAYAKTDAIFTQYGIQDEEILDYTAKVLSNPIELIKMKAHEIAEVIYNTQRIPGLGNRSSKEDENAAIIYRLKLDKIRRKLTPDEQDLIKLAHESSLALQKAANELQPNSARTLSDAANNAGSSAATLGTTAATLDSGSAKAPTARKLPQSLAAPPLRQVSVASFKAQGEPDLTSELPPSESVEPEKFMELVFTCLMPLNLDRFDQNWQMQMLFLIIHEMITKRLALQVGQSFLFPQAIKCYRGAVVFFDQSTVANTQQQPIELSEHSQLEMAHLMGLLYNEYSFLQKFGLLALAQHLYGNSNVLIPMRSTVLYTDKGSIESSPFIVDDVKIHLYSIKTKHLEDAIDPLSPYNHLAIFLYWAMRRGLTSVEFSERFPKIIDEVFADKCDLREFVKNELHGRLMLWLFTVEIHAFVKIYYNHSLVVPCYPSDIDNYALAYFGPEKYISETMQDEAYLFVPYTKKYIMDMFHQINKCFQYFMVKQRHELKEEIVAAPSKLGALFTLWGCSYTTYSLAQGPNTSYFRLELDYSYKLRRGLKNYTFPVLLHASGHWPLGLMYSKQENAQNALEANPLDQAFTLYQLTGIKQAFNTESLHHALKAQDRFNQLLKNNREYLGQLAGQFQHWAWSSLERLALMQYGITNQDQLTQLQIICDCYDVMQALVSNKYQVNNDNGFISDWNYTPLNCTQQQALISSIYQQINSNLERIKSEQSWLPLTELKQLCLIIQEHLKWTDSLNSALNFRVSEESFHTRTHFIDTNSYVGGANYSITSPYMNMDTLNVIAKSRTLSNTMSVLFQGPDDENVTDLRHMVAYLGGTSLPEEQISEMPPHLQEQMNALPPQLQAFNSKYMQLFQPLPPEEITADEKRSASHFCLLDTPSFRCLSHALANLVSCLMLLHQASSNKQNNHIARTVAPLVIQYANLAVRELKNIAPNAPGPQPLNYGKIQALLVNREQRSLKIANDIKLMLAQHPLLRTELLDLIQNHNFAQVDRRLSVNLMLRTWMQLYVREFNQLAESIKASLVSTKPGQTQKASAKTQKQATSSQDTKHLDAMSQNDPSLSVQGAEGIYQYDEWLNLESITLPDMAHIEQRLEQLNQDAQFNKNAQACLPKLIQDTQLSMEALLTPIYELPATAFTSLDYADVFNTMVHSVYTRTFNDVPSYAPDPSPNYMSDIQNAGNGLIQHLQATLTADKDGDITYQLQLRYGVPGKCDYEPMLPMEQITEELQIQERSGRLKLDFSKFNLPDLVSPEDLALERKLDLEVFMANSSLEQAEKQAIQRLKKNGLSPTTARALDQESTLAMIKDYFVYHRIKYEPLDGISIYKYPSIVKISHTNEAQQHFAEYVVSAQNAFGRNILTSEQLEDHIEDATAQDQAAKANTVETVNKATKAAYKPHEIFGKFTSKLMQERFSLQQIHELFHEDFYTLYDQSRKKTESAPGYSEDGITHRGMLYNLHPLMFLYPKLHEKLGANSLFDQLLSQRQLETLKAGKSWQEEIMGNTAGNSYYEKSFQPWQPEQIRDMKSHIQGQGHTQNLGSILSSGSRSSLITSSPQLSSSELYLVEFPIHEPWELWCILSEGQWNRYVDAITWIELNREWYEKYGVRPKEVAADQILYTLNQGLTFDQAQVVAKQIFCVCPQILELGSISQLTSYLTTTTTWLLKWPAED